MVILLHKKTVLRQTDKRLAWRFGGWFVDIWEFKENLKDRIAPYKKILEANGINATWHIDSKKSEKSITGKSWFATVKFDTEDDQNMALMMFGEST